MYWIGYSLVFLGGSFLGAGLPLIARRWVRPVRRRGLENLALLLISLFLTFMAVEFFFKVFFAQTENRNFTLASRNWFERYWTLNSMGYRDVEWPVEALQNKRKILVSGDSFAAGQGIERVEDRFSNLLGQKLGPDYLVMNIAQPGFSTKEEIERLKTFSYRPQLLIHQYYLNDIRHAAEQRQLLNQPPQAKPWPALQPLIDHSYALNFIYWRGTLLGPQEWQGNEISWLNMVYNDPDTWGIHQQELLTLTEGAASGRIPLIVVVFPTLTDVTGSRELSDKVVNWFREKNVTVLDVADLVEGVPPEQLVVSPLDSHPGEWLHAQVAEALYELVLQLPTPAALEP